MGNWLDLWDICRRSATTQRGGRKNTKVKAYSKAGGHEPLRFSFGWFEGTQAKENMK